MASTPVPSAPSPSSQVPAPSKDVVKSERSIVRVNRKAEDCVSSATVTEATAAASVSVSAPPKRAPLPNKQPKTKISATKGTAGPPTLPRISAPSPSYKMAMSAIVSPVPSGELPKMSMTSKEWVIPPRPKPGRKPATDTPPTKRKAQNRAAQRAFRERRAARVGELEQQLDEVREAHQKDEDGLKEKIHNLELDLQSFRSRCMLLENMLERERQDRIRAETQAEGLRRGRADDFYRSQSSNGSSISHPTPQHPAPQLTQHSVLEDHGNQLTQGRNLAISQIITPSERLAAGSGNREVDSALTCGNCSPDGACACAAQAIATTSINCDDCSFGASCRCLNEIIGSQGQTTKRAASPSTASSGGKRHRSQVNMNMNTETDFTAIFSKNPSGVDSASQPLHEEPSFSSEIPSGGSMAFKEDCGFCKDGTYCVCAEDAAGMATPAMTPTESMAPASQQTRTPPPSEPEVQAGPFAMEMTSDGSVKLPRRIQGKNPRKTSTALFASTLASSSATNGCGASGPGTCAQCQADPKSGLFCRLMNAQYSREQSGPLGGCCGGQSAGGGCCKSRAAPEKITLPSLPSLGLSCAEAYQTLSSHRNFSKAADDISSWLPKLKTTAPAPIRGPAPGRQAIEVEAASIMSVLKEFDVRFGRDA